tara:strand:+ start:9260 stop:9685 length:426 start_codon:yes stop_codon:yes gene_type:complete
MIATLARVPLYVWSALSVAGIMSVLLFVQNARLANAKDDYAKLYADINEPKTGYVARLTTCQASVATLEESIGTQNKAIEDLKRTSDEAIERANAAAKEAALEADAARKRARDMANRPIQGETVLDRVLDVDAAFLEALEQ